MRLIATGVALLLTACQAYAYDYWNDIRYSALLPDSTVVLRVENVSGTGVGNFALFNEGGVQMTPMTPVVDGPSTLAASVPGPRAETRHYGFRLVEGEEIDFLPVRIPDGATPSPEDLSQISADPLGDESYGYANLDILDSRMSYSGDRLFGSITNAGGGFPVSQGLTFFGYTIAIADPALADPDTVFGLMHTLEEDPIISPGLYKITGTGLGDLTKLGEVVVEEYPGSDAVVISCDLADLTGDPYFMSWYDPADPVMGIAAFTQRITILGGPAEADRCLGGRCYLREFAIDPGANSLPVLMDFTLQGDGPTAVAQISYSDLDSHCPVVAEIVFDGALPYPMYPLTLDYGSPVTYSTEPGIDPLANSTWTGAVLYFSDNLADSVEYAAPQVGVDTDLNPTGSRGLRASVMPNPCRGAATVLFSMPAAGELRIEAYDVKGSAVATVIERRAVEGPGSAMWTLRDGRGTPVTPGIYFLRVSALGQDKLLKLVVVN